MTARYTFGRGQRLRSRGEFHDCLNEGVKESRGPLTIIARGTDRAYPRLGIRIPRAVGTAPRRNRIKRLLREAFRLMQHDFPRGYDWVIVVRPHAPLRLADYQRILSGALVKLHQRWEARESRS